MRSLLSRRYEEHIGGSPYTYLVSEGPTDPDSCLLDFNPSVKAGEEFRVEIKTYDFHSNPTEHFDDVFLCTPDDGIDVEVNRADDGTVTCPILVTAAGPNRLTIVHVPTSTEVAGSPVSFDVLPADPSATASTASAGNSTSIESGTDTSLPLQVFLRDEYGNEVFDAPNVAVQVQVQGLDLIDPSEIEEHTLEGPKYIHIVTIPRDLEITLNITFSLDGDRIDEPI